MRKNKKLFRAGYKNNSFLFTKDNNIAKNCSEQTTILRSAMALKAKKGEQTMFHHFLLLNLNFSESVTILSNQKTHFFKWTKMDLLDVGFNLYVCEKKHHPNLRYALSKNTNPAYL